MYDHNLERFSYTNVKTIDLGPLIAAKYLHRHFVDKKKEGQYTNTTAYYATHILSNKDSQKGLKQYPNETATKIKAIANELAARKKKVDDPCAPQRRGKASAGDPEDLVDARKTKRVRLCLPPLQNKLLQQESQESLSGEKGCL